MNDVYKNIESIPQFGDVFFAHLKYDGNVQGGVRPVIIAQNNVGNKFSPTVEIIPISSQINKAKHLPTHVVIRADRENGLSKDSVVLAEQVATINKDRLTRRIGKLSYENLVSVGRARNTQSPFPLI